MSDMLILISSLVGTSVAALCYGLYRSRHGQTLVAERLVPEGGRSRPRTLDEEELSERFVVRVLQPFFRRLLAAAGRFTPAGNIERLQRDLLLAGHPASLTLLDFLGLKLLSAVLVGVGAFALLMARQMPGLPALLFAMAAAMVGLYLPNFWLQRRKRARQKAIARALPDALDMLTICVDAGLGFEAALMNVAERWNNELTREFARVVSEIRMGVRRDEALRHMVERTEVPEVASFVAVLIQANRLGVGITNVLHSQSEQARTRRRQRAEEEAHKAPIKMLIPMVFCILPATFAVILGPAVPRFLGFFSRLT
ncbi:MAG: type II secretion system F family protein [Anaerolineae bacterium]|nr:type II secretion system F family protein [Anaerolineae bacterium]